MQVKVKFPRIEAICFSVCVLSKFVFSQALQLIRSRRNGSSDWSTTSLPLQRLQIFHWSIKNSAFEVGFDWSIKNSSLAHI